MYFWFFLTNVDGQLFFQNERETKLFALEFHGQGLCIDVNINCDPLCEMSHMSPNAILSYGQFNVENVFFPFLFKILSCMGNL